MTLNQLVERTGAGIGYVQGILKNLVAAKVIKVTEDKKYFIDPSNPVRYALDGYFREGEKKLEKQNANRKSAKQWL